MTDAPSHISAESGFSLSEVLVVMVVMGIIMAIAIPSYSGARTTANGKVSRTVANSLGSAITLFQQEHSARTPKFNTSEDWPVVLVLPGTDTNKPPTKGPINAAGLPYIRHLPEALADKSVTVEDGNDPSLGSGDGGRVGRVLYERTGTTNFTLTAQARKNSTSFTTICVLTNRVGVESTC